MKEINSSSGHVRGNDADNFDVDIDLLIAAV